MTPVLQKRSTATLPGQPLAKRPRFEYPTRNAPDQTGIMAFWTYDGNPGRLIRRVVQVSCIVENIDISCLSVQRINPQAGMIVTNLHSLPHCDGIRRTALQITGYKH